MSGHLWPIAESSDGDRIGPGTKMGGGGPLPFGIDSPTGHLPTIREILDLEVMRGATVIAGTAGLDRAVRGINIIEVPDVWQWLEGGELLLSAGYAWHDHPERMVNLAQKLEEVKIAGIAFKLGRYLDRVPDELLAAADRSGLPVIKLPGDVAYREVLESLYGSLASRAGLFDLSRRAKQAFIHFSLDEQSIEKVVGALARQLRSDVLVVDRLDEEVVRSSPDGVVRRTPFDALDERTSRIVKDLADQELRRSPSEVRLGDDLGSGAALVVGHRTQGHIVAVSGDPVADDAAAAAIAHAGELVSFLLLKRLALLEGRREAGGLFLESLMSDALTNEEAAERALTLGLRLTRPCSAFVLGSLAPPVAPQALEAVLRSIDRALSSTPHVMAPGRDGSTLLGLVQLDEQDEDVLTQVLARVRLLADEEGLGKPIIGSGSSAVGLEGVRRSRSEALIAYETGVRLNQDGLIPFEGLGAERLLAQIPNRQMAEDYVASLLGPLEQDPELLRTIEVYLQHGGNKVATAAAMPLHRSSLVYRLQKASALLEIDLNSPEHCLELWLAIRLRRILSLS